MTIHRFATRQELLIHIADCTQAIKAFKIGCKHLAPDDLSGAPSVEWLRKQQMACRKQLQALGNG